MGLLQQKFTGIVLGILVIEDLVAVVMMVILSTLAVGKHFEGKEMLESILKLAAFLIFWSALGIYLIPTLLKKIRRFTSNEILLITSLGLCLGMVMIATKAGFSAALGAFVMGSLLAETVEAEKIAHIVQPVKDLFASIFFVSVGMMIDPAMMWEYAVPILILTLLVLSGQVLFGSFGVLLSGQPLKIAIQSGFSLTQVGEFAFIIASLGVSLNVTDKYLYPVIVAVSVITTFLTPYMIRLSEPAYRFIDIHMPGFLKDYLVHYTSGAMTVKHQGTWHKLIRSMLVSVTLYLVVCVFFITLYFSYVHPLIRKSLPGMEGNLLGFIIIWVVASEILDMRLTGTILDKFMSIGLIVLVILFQDQIKRFLIDIGSQDKWKFISRMFSHRKDQEKDHSQALAVVYACNSMSRSKTGALIVLQQNMPLTDYEKTGDIIDADINMRLIENIFFKNSPLHDGALIIAKGRMVSAGCILPVSHTMNIPKQLGLRHSAA